MVAARNGASYFVLQSFQVGTPTMHWEVARMYTEPKSVDPNDTCFFRGRAPHITCHECKVPHCTSDTSILCQSEMCVGLCLF